MAFEEKIPRVYVSREDMLKRVARFKDLKGFDGGLPDSYMPSAERVREVKAFHIFGDRIFHPALWHLNRRTAAGGVAIGLRPSRPPAGTRPRPCGGPGRGS